MARPIIGISGTFLEDKQQILLRETYTNAILEAGGLPFILPTVSDEAVIRAMLDQIDGLLLSGGGDVDPEHYGEQRLPECGEPNARRDEFELRITKMAKDRRIPISGICRGIQVLSVVYGSKLIQDIPSVCGIPLEKHRQPEPFNLLWHEIELTKGGLLTRITGLTHAMTNSMHHQAIALPGGTLVVEATTADGIIEAVSDCENAAVFGVQFHPEFLTENGDFAKALFAYFVKTAKEYRNNGNAV